MDIYTLSCPPSQNKTQFLFSPPPPLRENWELNGRISERFWSMEAVRNCLWKSCWKTVTGDYHENQDESTQMTMKAERLKKWTPGLELEKKQRKVIASEWAWSMQENEHVQKVVAQRIREPVEPAWGLPGAWEVGQDSMLGNSIEKMVDSKLETSLELNVIQFLFYLDWTFLILQVRFASMALLCVLGCIGTEAQKRSGHPRDVVRGREKCF